MKKLSTRTIAIMSIYCALFIVLDRVSDALNLFKMASGGKLNFSPAILLIASYHLGYKKGMFVGVVSVFLQLVIGSVSWYGPLSFMLDYMIAYSIYGLAALFPNYKYFYSGVFITSLLRLVSSTLAGTLVWETPFWASMAYNASYMIPTTIFAIIFVPLVCERLQPLMKRYSD